MGRAIRPRRARSLRLGWRLEIASSRPARFGAAPAAGAAAIAARRAPTPSPDLSFEVLQRPIQNGLDYAPDQLRPDHRHQSRKACHVAHLGRAGLRPEVETDLHAKNAQHACSPGDPAGWLICAQATRESPMPYPSPAGRHSNGVGQIVRAICSALDPRCPRPFRVAREIRSHLPDKRRWGSHVTDRSKRQHGRNSMAKRRAPRPLAGCWWDLITGAAQPLCRRGQFRSGW